jgi:DHA2 family multidrug resistance protein-like MFS transporter
MNDATRELGAALGVAVLGSVTATHYASAIHPVAERVLPAGAVDSASRSLANAIEQAGTLPGAGREAFTTAAQHAFLGGVHVSVVIAAALAATTAVLVLRYLPRSIRHGDLHVVNPDEPVLPVEGAVVAAGGAPMALAVERSAS